MEMESLTADNFRLEEKIRVNQAGQNNWDYFSSDKQDAIALFEQKLNGITGATKELTQTKSKEDMETTVQLW